VHGAAASYIAGLLDLRGPSLTTTDFEIGFEHAVLLAQSWLDQGICRRVLVGAVEELSETMIQIASKLLKGRESISLGEGAVFLMLASDTRGIARIDASSTPTEIDLLARDEPAILPENDSPHSITAKQTVTFNPYFGHTASSSAFQLLGCLLSQSISGGIASAATLRRSRGLPVTLRINV
jgi:hypothetical protein